MDSASMRARRRWYRRPSRIIPVVFVAALAIGVPVAWATFIDVPPSNPFYADINAIQGAGITSGCGGGNFCPTDNITRQAEAAFVHRAAGRAGVGFGTGAVTSDGVDLGDLTMSIGGVSGQTQFVMLTAQVDTQIQSLTGCPCETYFAIYSDTAADYVVVGSTMNDSLPAAGGSVADAVQSTVAAGVIPVASGTTQTFHLDAFLVGGTGTVTGYGTLNAITAPFGSTGTDTLGVQANALGHREGRRLPPPPK
jgi:hypothetical protein